MCIATFTHHHYKHCITLQDIALGMIATNAECSLNLSDSKVHGANMGLIWGQQDPGGPHVGPMNFDI